MYRTPKFILAQLIPLVLLTVSGLLGADHETDSPADSTAATNRRADRIDVYYLYMMPRCQTCLDIEAFSKEAIETAFTEEIADGRVEWHAYDTGLPEYSHYWDDFKLELKSLVMLEIRNGEVLRWKICHRVWDLVEDKPAFQAYVTSELKAWLKDM